MKRTNALATTFSLLAAVSVAAAAYAEATAESPKTEAVTKDSSPAADMTMGEVRKVDKAVGKITIRHGEIRNLGMPGMTMVFGVKDPALLDQLKAGDKIRFRAEKLDGRLVVTEVQPGK